MMEEMIKMMMMGGMIFGVGGLGGLGMGVFGGGF